MAYEMRSNPGNRLGIWAETIERKRVAMRLDRSGFPLPPDNQEPETEGENVQDSSDNG